MRPFACSVSASARKTRGFTLTEIAIVLGIIGLILGAIWVAASSVYSNMRVSKGTQQIMQITQAVRALYATSQTVDPAADMTCCAADATHYTYLQAGTFPGDMLLASGKAAQNVWQGYVSIQSQQNTIASDSFSIVYDAVPQSTCIALVTANTGPGRDSGLVGASVAAAGSDPIAAAANVSTSTWTTFPVLASQATTACSNTTNAVAFSFKLRG